MRILSVNNTTSEVINCSTNSTTTNASSSMAAARRPSQKSCKLLQEMDNSAKELLAFLGELEDKRNTHTLEFVSNKSVTDDTTRQIKDCLAERAKLYNEDRASDEFTSSSSSSSSIPSKVVSTRYQNDIKQASSSNYQSIKSKFEQNHSKSSSRNSSGRNSTNSSPNTTGSTSDNNSQPTSSSFGDSAISMDSDELLSLPPPPLPPVENKPQAYPPPSAFCKPALAPKPKKKLVSLPDTKTTNACETILKPADVVTTNNTVFEMAEEVYVSKYEAGSISCSKSKAVFDNIDTLPRRRRGVKKL